MADIIGTPSRKGLRKSPKWTPAEDEILRVGMRLGHPDSHLAQRLPGRTECAIKYRKCMLRPRSNSSAASRSASLREPTTAGTDPHVPATHSELPPEPVAGARACATPDIRATRLPETAPAADQAGQANRRPALLSARKREPFTLSSPEIERIRAINASLPKSIAIPPLWKCQFIRNDSWPFDYCGAERCRPDGAYCSEHEHLTHRGPMTSEERSAAVKAGQARAAANA